MGLVTPLSLKLGLVTRNASFPQIGKMSLRHCDHTERHTFLNPIPHLHLTLSTVDKLLSCTIRTTKTFGHEVPPALY
jgi:hypothetical protein